MIRMPNLQMERNLTIRVKIWLFFMMFVCIVFILMWILQVVFLERFYEAFKIADIAKSAKILTQSCRLDNFSDIAEDQAMQNEMCISILNTDGEETYQHCVSAQKCLLHNDQDVYFFLMDLKRSDNGYICRSIYNEQLQTQTVVYGNWILDSDTNEVVGYLLLNSRLVPVQSTVSILQRQTMIITLAMAFFGCILSFLAATHIGVPITRLTRSAKRLAHGDYETKFEGGGCAEVDELAEALTYAEHELSLTDEMQRDLIANVSHDMRTPLTMIKAYAEMIRDLSGNNPEKRAKHLQVIIEETDRLSLLVNDMLDLSKLESGTKKLEFTTFDISQRLTEIANRYQGISEQMGYHLHFTPDAPRMVCCDAGAIERVICNLINNAINYTSKEDKQVFLRQINQPDCVRIEVRDTGDGIEEDKIKLIFDKYYRSENHKREVVGTGLGLSIVKAILKLHNYDYGVNSKLGEGSTFWFAIRTDQQPAPEATPAIAPTESKKGDDHAKSK